MGISQFQLEGVRFLDAVDNGKGTCIVSMIVRMPPGSWRRWIGSHPAGVYTVAVTLTEQGELNLKGEHE